VETKLDDEVDCPRPAHGKLSTTGAGIANDDPFLWLEEGNIEGGHGGAANLKQRAYINTLIFSYLLERLAPPADE
jgi:prolyl oligopeptidase PreP (S9A serine peptidase family)